MNGKVTVRLLAVDDMSLYSFNTFNGTCLDDLDIDCTEYRVQSHYLSSDDNTLVNEQLYSHLLKSNCLVTGQPDWGSVAITYQGPQINHEGLLKYIVSFRNHNEFHEQCVERIFMDVLKHCKPTALTVNARYTRRGGLDINPVRSTETVIPATHFRMPRQ